MHNPTEKQMSLPSMEPRASQFHNESRLRGLGRWGHETQPLVTGLSIYSTSFVVIAILLIFSAIWVTGVKQLEASAQAQSPETSSSLSPNASLSALPTVDTYIAAGAPERRRPDLRVFWVGYNQEQASLDQYSLLGFDLVSLPSNSQISGARLSLHLSSTTSGDAPLEIAVNRIRGSWAEEINWQEMAAALANSSIQIVDGAATASVGTEFVEYEWDLTELVTAWQSDGRDGNNQLSLLLRSQETTTERERAFWSSDCIDEDCGATPGKRPLLTIDFTEAVAAPTPAATQTATPSPTQTTAPAKQPTAVATPTPNEGANREPAQALTVSIQYQIAGGEASPDFPEEWSVGEQLDVELLLEQVNGTETLNSVDIRSALPQGSNFISATESGIVDEEKRLINWSGISVPATGSQTVVFALEKPEPISAPQLIISQTAASNIFIFDAAAASGSDLQYEWNFNDGTPIVTRPDPFFLTPTIQRSFLEPGTYRVDLAIYNEACRFLLSEDVVVPPSVGKSTAGQTGALEAAAASMAGSTNTVAASEKSIYRSSPETDGTARLPWCPDTLTPTEPQIIITWSEPSSGQEQVQIINPAEGIYLPHFSAGR